MCNSFKLDNAENKSASFEGFKKRIAYILISVLLLALLLCSVSGAADANINSNYKLDLSELTGIVDTNKISVEYDALTGAATLTSDPKTSGYVCIGELGHSFDVLYITVDGALNGFFYTVYSRDDGTSDSITEIAIPLDDGRFMLTLFSPKDETVLLNVSADCSAKIAEIEAVSISGYKLRYEPNYVAIIILCATLVLLAVFNKKIGYFSAVKAFATNSFGNFASLRTDSKNKIFVLKIVSASATIGFVILAVVDFLFNVISPVYSFVLTLFAAVSIAGIITNRTLVEKNTRPEGILFALILILGSVIALTAPIGSQVCWDDGYHYANTAYIPLFLTNGGSIPIAAYKFATEQYKEALFSMHPDEVLGSIYYFGDHGTFAVNVSFILDFFKNFKWYYVFLIFLLPFAAIYYLFIYVAYIPGMITMFFFSAFGADMIKLFIVGKLANVICYGALCYFAVKKMKKGKYLFSSIALIPVCVFLGASYTCDWWINGAMLLGVAYFVSILQSKESKVSRRELIIMISAMAFACGPKEIYFLLMAPLLLIPNDRFTSERSAKRTRAVVVAVMLAILLSFAIPMLIDSNVNTDLRGGSDVSASGQIAFILANPFEYAKICINFMKGYVALHSMSAHVAMFAWLGSENSVYALISILTLFFCVFTDRGECDIYRGSLKIKLSGIVCSILQIILVITSLYVGFTPVGLGTVNGCQYRYLFPIFPMILYCISPLRIENKMSDSSKNALIFGLLALSTLGSYYVTYLSHIL